MTRLLTLLLLLGAFWQTAGAADTPVYQLIRPTDEAHNLLPKTCRVCHKDKDFHFFLVAAPSPEALERAADMLAGRAAVAGAPAAGPAGAPGNPHAAIACLFCHLEEPKGLSADQLSFRTLSGAAKRSELASHCQLCHPEGSQDHRRVVKGRGAAADLADAGLPLVGGQAGCTTCHEMHEAKVGPADVKPAYEQFAARSPESYPHGNRAACLACHPVAPAEGTAPAFTEADPTARCAHCHPADHGGVHPMAVKSSEKTYPLDFLDYPLDSEGRLSCSTCHDHPCPGPVDPANPRFLRGGPYVTATEFCYRCHPRAGLGTLNPHTQVDASGRIVTTTCAFCHRRIPDPEDPEEAYFGPEDLLFLHSPVELCLGCHESFPHPTGVNHLVEMPEARVRQLAAYEQRHGVKLPLFADSQIVCTTCHNPHDKGVLRGKAALGAAELHQWRVPTYAELCTPCHARYD